jgi:hypothetical protein
MLVEHGVVLAKPTENGSIWKFLYKIPRATLGKGLSISEFLLCDAFYKYISPLSMAEEARADVRSWRIWRPRVFAWNGDTFIVHQVWQNSNIHTWVSAVLPEAEATKYFATLKIQNVSDILSMENLSLILLPFNEHDYELIPFSGCWAIH